MLYARGPRQRDVASPRKLNKADLADLRGRWNDLRSLLRGKAPPTQTADLPGLELPALWESANISVFRVERTRDFGEIAPRRPPRRPQPPPVYLPSA